MRLTDRQVKCIVQAVHKRWGEGAQVYLFGSRLDDTLNGGDIDLFVDLPSVDDEVVRHTCQTIADIQLSLGEQKLDMVVRHPESNEQAIYHEALHQGVLLG